MDGKDALSISMLEDNTELGLYNSVKLLLYIINLWKLEISDIQLQICKVKCFLWENRMYSTNNIAPHAYNDIFKIFIEWNHVNQEAVVVEIAD